MAVINICELADVKNVLQIPTDDTTFDEVIQGIILGISKTFEVMTGRFTHQTVREEIFDCYSYTEKLYLKGWPVDAQQEWHFYYDPDRVYGAETEVDPEDYFPDPETGVVDLLKSFSVGKKVFKVTYTGGMAVDTENFISDYQDINSAAIAQAVYLFNSIPNLGANLIRVRQDMIEITKPLSRLPLFVLAALNNSRMSL